MKSREREFPLMEKVGDAVFLRTFTNIWEKDITTTHFAGLFLFHCDVCLSELLGEKSRLINYNKKSSTGDLEGLLRHAYADVCCRSSWIYGIIYNAAPDPQGDFLCCASICTFSSSNPIQ